MTDAQLDLAIGIPSALFALNFLAILWQACALERPITSSIGSVTVRIDALEKRSSNRSMPSSPPRMKASWRVEGVLRCLLKHLEDR
jgi:hypothetical protein